MLWIGWIGVKCQRLFLGSWNYIKLQQKRAIRIHPPGLEEAIRQSLEALQERMSSQATAEIRAIPGCPVAAYGTAITTYIYIYTHTHI